ncbi:MAG: Conserved exported protein [Nitrospira sp.]
MKFFLTLLNGVLFLGVALAPLIAGTARAESNLVTKPSHYSVAETIDRIEQAVTAKGMKVFTRIDHAGEAKNVGLTMRPTQLLIFGNPKGGTALMVVRPTAAIDLPMKALAWEDAEGKVWLTYNAPELFQERHGVPIELTSKLTSVGALLEQAVE